MADYSYYTRRIRDIREDNDLTQQQIAEILGTSQTMYARYERGANELPIRHLINGRFCTAEFRLSAQPVKRDAGPGGTNTETKVSHDFWERRTKT